SRARHRAPPPAARSAARTQAPPRPRPEIRTPRGPRARSPRTAGSPALAQPRQDVAGELLQGAFLVVAGEVEDELFEAEIHVGGDPLDDLVGIVRDDEAAARLVPVLVGEALHLDRVLDARL